MGNENKRQKLKAKQNKNLKKDTRKYKTKERREKYLPQKLLFFE